MYNHLKQRYFLKSINYFQLFSDDPTFFPPHNFMLVILSHQVNLMKALVPPPSQAPALSEKPAAPPALPLVEIQRSRDFLGRAGQACFAKGMHRFGPPS